MSGWLQGLDLETVRAWGLQEGERGKERRDAAERVLNTGEFAVNNKNMGPFPHLPIHRCRRIQVSSVPTNF